MRRNFFTNGVLNFKIPPNPATLADEIGDEDAAEWYISQGLKPIKSTLLEMLRKRDIKKSKKDNIKKDIKLLKKDIKKTNISKSTFNPEIESMKNKLKEVSNKLFTKKVKSTIDSINKTKIKSKSKYDSEKFTEGKNKIAQIEARLQDNNL